MDQYTIHCTKEQTLKAIELGAPIKAAFLDIPNKCEYKGCNIEIPTAEQMIGWLEEIMPISDDFQIKQVIVESRFDGTWDYFLGLKESDDNYISRKEASRAAIDAALEYLTKKKSHEEN